VLGDFQYLTDNAQLDLEDIVTSPLHVAGPDSLLRSPRFYLGVAVAGALFGGSFALDQTVQSHLGGMSHSDHDIMENVSYVSLISATGLLYAYGLYAGDDRARHYFITGYEGAGMGALFNLALGVIFGRLRPFQTGSHTAFFSGGDSFTSVDTIITASIATGLSEYFDHKWYIAAPLYALVLVEGFTRVGNMQQWFSDAVMGAVLGWGTTELLLWLHEEHESEPGRFRIWPITPPSAAAGGNLHRAVPEGIAVAYSW
jgi:membrane-associated phospholipid phosphatase